jgi:hypothetical protein
VQLLEVDSLQPLENSLAAASCGSLASRKRPANSSKDESREMVTDSVALRASAENSGSSKRAKSAKESGRAEVMSDSGATASSQ